MPEKVQSEWPDLAAEMANYDLETMLAAYVESRRMAHCPWRDLIEAEFRRRTGLENRPRNYITH